MKTMQPAIYILANKKNGTLYVGVTSDLAGRISIHKQDLMAGFSSRYGVHLLVYFEFHHTMEEAIKREKQLKKFGRKKKNSLIENGNSAWRDLYFELSGYVETGDVH
jgi:putative endonuclease